MANDRQVGYRGLWIPIVCFAIAGLAILPESPYRNWVQSVVGVNGGDDSPQDFLAKQIAIGVSAGSGLLLIVLLAAFTCKRYWYWSSLGVVAALIMLLQPTVYAVSLLWGCFRLIDPSKARSLTHDNGLQECSMIVAISAAAALATYAFSRDALRRIRRKSADDADREMTS